VLEAHGGHSSIPSIEAVTRQRGPPTGSDLSTERMIDGVTPASCAENELTDDTDVTSSEWKSPAKRGFSVAGL
jgi:hypothetical protein